MRGRHIMAVLIIGIAASGIARAQTPDSRKDEEAIKAIISASTDAFSKHDAKAWVQYCTNDAQLVTVRGRHVALKTLEVSVRFVRPDVALAHVKNELSGRVTPTRVPSAVPAASNANALPATVVTTCERRAPRATRIPISRVRRVTMNESSA